jgi:hypothetical protein
MADTADSLLRSAADRGSQLELEKEVLPANVQRDGFVILACFASPWQEQGSLMLELLIIAAGIYVFRKRESYSGTKARKATPMPRQIFG